jgi:glycosyltransferase involved in cell wall biosynthesis
MKTVFINNLYSPYAVGGAETVVEGRMKDSVTRGDRVVLITSSSWKGWKSWVPQKGMEGDIVIYRFWVPNLCWYKNLSKHGLIFKLVWHFIDLFNFWSGKIVKSILDKENPDLVETHNLMGIGYDFGMKKKGLETKWKHYLHDVQLVEPSGVLSWNYEKDNLYQKIYSRITKNKFKDVDFVVSPSIFLKEFYEERGFFLNSDFIVENSTLKITNDRKQIPNKLQNENYKFLFVGSLVEHKGLRVLMQAWDNLEDNGQELHIVGDGLMREEMEKWAELEKRIIVHGRLEGEKLEEMYRDSNILIFASTCIENNPTVIHEAMHYGLGVIAADTGGVREILDRDNSWLYIPDDVEGLIKIVKRFI